VTVTGSVRGDLALITPIIGAGEVALSDHRSSQPSFQDFAGLVAEARVGGLLGGKRGLVQVHMGGGKRGMEYIFRMLEETELPPAQVLPTHCARSQDLLAQAMSLVRMGGNVDVTAEAVISGGRSGAALAMENFLEKGLPLERLTVSSDAGGSIPRFDNKGDLTGMSVALPNRMQTEFRRLVEEEDHDPQIVLPLFTRNPACRIGMGHTKGSIGPGMDADLLLFDGGWNLTDVFSLGRLVVSNGAPVLREAVSFD
jgi:beta-aspartyl-dipeptidase (metallo-type)